MNLKNIMLNKIDQVQKDKHHSYVEPKRVAWQMLRAEFGEVGDGGMGRHLPMGTMLQSDRNKFWCSICTVG
jgi:hypothetical protein